MATIKEIEYWFSEALNVPKENRIEYLESQLSNSPNLLEEVRTLVLSEGDTESVLTQLRKQLANETDLADGGEFPIIDKYDLLEEIGRGGMAVVYRSKRTDGVFDHDVALKVLKRGMDTDDIIRRFRQERKVLARLRHPNIGQIYDGGVTSDGRPYFVMELIEGQNIVDYANNTDLSTSKRLGLFVDACKAVEFAHQNLIIHRDIKPSNLLINKNGEVKLMDFGIAKVTTPDEAGEFTLPEHNVMTPKFASPEQVNNEVVDIRSDLFQLGRVLELLHADLNTDPDLRAIANLCLRSNKNDRYVNVSELLHDLDNYAKSKPVKARSGNNYYAFKKYLSRNKFRVISAAIVILILLSVTVAFVWRERTSNQRILREKRTAEGTLNTFLTIFSQAYPAYSQGDTLNAFDLLTIGDTILAKRANDPLMHSRFLNLIGEIYVGFNQLDLAKRYFQRSVDTFESGDFEYVNSQENLFRVYGNLVDVYLNLDNYDSAYYYLGLNEQYAAKNEESDLALSNVYGRVAWLEANRKNYPRAIEYYEKSIDAVPKSSIPIVLAIKKTFYARFLCYYDAIKYEDKIDSLYTASHQLFLKNGYDDTRKNDYATLVNFIGIFHMDLDRLDSAQHYFDKSLAINLELFGTNNLATLDNLNNLAVIKLKNEQYVEARQEFRDIWLRANKAGIVPSSSLVYYKNYALTFNKLGDFESAEIKFDSLTAYREKYLQNDLVRLNNSRKELAEAAIGNQKYEKAEGVLRSIIRDHQKSMPDDGEQDIRAYIELAKIKKIKGDEVTTRKIKGENRARILKRLGPDAEVYTLNEAI